MFARLRSAHRGADAQSTLIGGGISHIFNSRYGKFYYEVAGQVENDVRIVLAGKAPAGLDANCKPTRTIDDRLVFTYLRTER